MGSEIRKRDKYRKNDSEKSRRRRSRSRSPLNKRDQIRKRRRSPYSSDNSKVRQKEVSPVKENDTKKLPEKKSKETDMLNTRTGGAYIPPARLRMMQAQITDKSSVAYQRLAWEALKKSIHGHINKINVGNIGIIIKQLLKENIVRGRGLLCRSVIQAQAASPTFTNVYAALVAAVNSRFPNIGELLLKRLVIQFKRGFKRNDKSICISSASFVAHLVNQRVAHEILALELLTLLVESPTDDSVEVAIAFLKECGQKLTEVSSKGVNAIFEMLRNILHEGQLDKRVQYMIEVMFQVWKDGFKDHPSLISELELVPEEEQFTHLLMLDDATDPQDILNVFKFDEKYEENEQKYKDLSKEILGSDAESDNDVAESESGSGTEESEDEEEEENKQGGVTIIDNTETNLIALRRTIYLTINSSLDFEECAHKLMKMQLKPGQEKELCHMFLDCCAEQRTYEKFYGLLAQRFCNINRIYIGPFEEIFKDSYATAHRLDTNRLRNVSKFFGHLLFTDSISWEVLECVKLNEEDTTSSSRIYIKILFQELAEYMGLKKLNDRLKDPTLQEAFSGIFPRDNPKNTRFSINFFTSIGLGGLTDELREHLKQMPKNLPPPIASINVESSDLSSDSDSSSESSDSTSSSNDSSDSSKSEKGTRKSKKKGNNGDKQKKTDIAESEDIIQEKDIGNNRWGHDGFYDTYGKDARRFESNTVEYKGDQTRNKDLGTNKDPKDRSGGYNSNKRIKEKAYHSNFRDRTQENNSDKDSRRERDEQRQYKDSNYIDRQERDKGVSDEKDSRRKRERDEQRPYKNRDDNYRQERDKRNNDEKDSRSKRERDEHRQYKNRNYNDRQEKDKGNNDEKDSRSKTERNELRQYKVDVNDRQERGERTSKNRRNGNEEYERSETEKRNLTDKESHKSKYEKKNDGKLDKNQDKQTRQTENDNDIERNQKKASSHREYDTLDSQGKWQIGEQQESNREKRRDRRKEDRNSRSEKGIDKEAKKNRKEQEEKNDSDGEPNQEMDHEKTPQRYWDTFDLNARDKSGKESKNDDNLIKRKRDQ